MLSSLLTQLAANPMLAQAALVPLETSVNSILRHDPAAVRAIAAHAGRLVCIEIDALPPLYVRLLNNGVAFSLSNDASADVIMRGSLADFKALARADNKANQLINSDIDMDGDTELSIALTKMVQQLDIDWEALIQPLTGGLLAHQLGKSVRGLFRWGKTTSATYAVAGKDYLEDEAQLVAPEPLLAGFASEVDELRLASDRLAARIRQLEVDASAAEEPQPDNQP